MLTIASLWWLWLVGLVISFVAAVMLGMRGISRSMATGRARNLIPAIVAQIVMMVCAVLLTLALIVQTLLATRGG